MHSCNSQYVLSDYKCLYSYCFINTVTPMDSNSTFEVNIGLYDQYHYVGLDRGNVQPEHPMDVEPLSDTQHHDSDNPSDDFTIHRKTFEEGNTQHNDSDSPDDHEICPWITPVLSTYILRVSCYDKTIRNTNLVLYVICSRHEVA